MTRRPGMSLTEVLVALFILTLGVIGILTMFPLGAAQMARAVRDDRSAQAAAQADGFMRWYWQMYVANPVLATANAKFSTSYFTVTPQPVNNTILSYGNNNNQLYSYAGVDPNFTNGTTGLFDNPANWGMAATTVLATTPQMTYGNMVKVTAPGPNSGLPQGLVSFPVIVDPMGATGPRGVYFGDATSAGYAAIPRYGLNPNLIQTQSVYRMCSLIDSLGYNDNGLPTPDLEMRYNWLWVLQRPQAMTENWSDFNNQNILNIFNANNLSHVNMTVVVFDRRAYKYPPPSVLGFETVMQAAFTTGLTAVTIPATSATAALDLKPGSWVMDASSVPVPAAPYPGWANPPIRQGNFYRVVSVTPTGNTVTLELQAPVAAPTGYPPLGYPYTGTLVALNGVSGVFVRPPLTPYPQ